MSTHKKGARIKPRPDGAMFAAIADEDTITGFLLAGIGNVDTKRHTNFLVVDSRTTKQTIEDSFKGFIAREDIAVILISQYIADDIRPLLDEYDHVIPTVLEIPSKEHPYDGSKDSIMTRIKRMTGQKEE